MDLFIYQLKKETSHCIQYLYVDSWNLVLKVLSELDGTQDSVSVTCIKVINKFD